jgi:transposase
MAQRHSSDDPTSSGVIIGVDPHKASHTAAVLGTRRQVLAHLRVPSDRAGYRQLRRWSARWPRRLWAVENTAGLGSSLTQWLLNDGEQVVDVPAKLSARVRLLSSGHGRKTDQADALSTAMAACGTAELQPAVIEGHATTLRLLSDRRDELMASRTQTLNRLHGLLTDLAPGQVPTPLSAHRAATLLRHIRVSAGPAQTRRLLAVDLLHDVRRLDTLVARIDQQIAAAVKQSHSGLTDLFGIGPVLAAKILGRIGEVRRFPTAARFAS